MSEANVMDLASKAHCMTPKPELDGLRVRVPGDAHVYLVDRGYRRWIPDPGTYGQLFRSTADIREDTGVAEIPIGAPIVSGSVLVMPDREGKVCFFDQGKLRWVTGPGMEKYQFNWGQIRKLPNVVFDSLPDAPDGVIG